MKLTKGRIVLGSVLLTIVLILLWRYVGVREARELHAVPENWSQIRSAALLMRETDDVGALLKAASALKGRSRNLVLVTAGNPDKTAPEMTQLVNDVVTLPERHYWDEFVVLANRNGKHVLLRSEAEPKSKGVPASKSLARTLGWKTRKSGLVFESGDIVVGRERAYVTEETVRRNAERLRKSAEKTTSLFERKLGKPVHILRGLPDSAPPICELLAEIDERTVIVADPVWGARLIRGSLGTRKTETSATSERAKSIFGDAFQAILESSEDLGPAMKRTAEELEKQGYVVRRVPAVFARGERQPRLSYTAALMETMGDRRVVYLPQYGDEASDEAARKVWEANGFMTVPIEGYPASGPMLPDCARVLERQ